SNQKIRSSPAALAAATRRRREDFSECLGGAPSCRRRSRFGKNLAVWPPVSLIGSETSISGRRGRSPCSLLSSVNTSERRSGEPAGQRLRRAPEGPQLGEGSLRRAAGPLQRATGAARPERARRRRKKHCAPRVECDCGGYRR